MARRLPEAELVRTAARGKLLDPNRLMFVRLSDEVARGPRARGVPERDVLEGFERSRRP